MLDDTDAIALEAAQVAMTSPVAAEQLLDFYRRGRASKHLTDDTPNCELLHSEQQLNRPGIPVSCNRPRSTEIEHSEQAIAAYPNNCGGGTCSSLGNERERIAFDRGLALRHLTDRETVARIIATEARDYNEHGVLLWSKHLHTADAILSHPQLSLVAVRDEVAAKISEIWFSQDDHLNLYAVTLADALFASNTITERGDVEAGALEAAADARYADEIQGAYTSAPVWLRARAARIRSGKAEA